MMDTSTREKLLKIVCNKNYEKNGVTGVTGVTSSNTKAYSDFEGVTRNTSVTPQNTPQSLVNTGRYTCNTCNTSKSEEFDVKLFERLIDAFDERAAMLEYDGGFPRNVAEKMALVIILESFTALINEQQRKALESYAERITPEQGIGYGKKS